MLLRALISTLLVVLAGGALAECRSDVVYLRGDWGSVRFNIEIADTNRERSRGLMFRKNMPTGDGMLFVYDQPERVSFWMKNTLIPLDMIFTDRDGVILHIHQNAIPGDETPIPSGVPVRAVLEINAGLTQFLGIKVGGRLKHRIFGNL